MAESPSPNVLQAAWSILGALRTRRPRPTGVVEAEHDDLGAILVALRHDGVPALDRRALAAYRDRLESLNPDDMSRPHALAFWMNLYNAGALDLAAEAHATGTPTVLDVPGRFERPWATIDGEHLSLDDIEHGKIRRFGDPRIHGALVCGSASCPTLRHEPFTGNDIHAQLDDQLRTFLAAGGALRRDDRLSLSRVFLWYGSDFVRPHRMPTFIPSDRRRVAVALTPWMNAELAAWVRVTKPQIEFQPYDWGLSCSIG